MAIATSGRGNAGRNALGRTGANVLALLPFYAANTLTLLRICLILPLLYAVAEGSLQVATVILLVAAASDALDGMIARRFAGQSRFGAAIDPLADKLLLGSLYGLLAFQGVLPLWLFAGILVRDLAILCGGLLTNLNPESHDVRPLAVGKFATFLQLALALAVLLEQAGQLQRNVVLVLIAVVAIVTAISAVVYLAVVLTPSAGHGRT